MLGRIPFQMAENTGFSSIRQSASICAILLDSACFDRAMTFTASVMLDGEYRRILSSQVSSERLGKFFPLLYFSTGYQKRRLHRYDSVRRVLNMELLQFYYSPSRTDFWHNRSIQVCHSIGVV